MKGADRLWSYCAGHKGALVSRRHFILVHIPTPMGQPGLWLSGEQSKITAIALTHRISPLESPHRHIYTPPHAVPYRNTLTGARSYHWEGSESMFICLQWEEQEDRLQENTPQLLYMAGLFAAQYTCYLNSYLMVSHTDIRTHCVVNNTLLTIFSLKRKMNFYAMWTWQNVIFNIKSYI